MIEDHWVEDLLKLAYFFLGGGFSCRFMCPSLGKVAKLAGDCGCSVSLFYDELLL